MSKSKYHGPKAKLPAEGKQMKLFDEVDPLIVSILAETFYVSQYGKVPEWSGEYRRYLPRKH